MVPVHFAGQPCDMEAIHNLAAEYNFKIIEDASHAIGSKYGNSQTGCCRYSDVTIFSFHPVKIITSGEGGMVLTNNETTAKKIALLRSHGISKSPRVESPAWDGDWFYEQTDLGHNYRLTDIQAALGISQFARLEEYISARRDISEFYFERLADLPVILPYQCTLSQSSFHLFPVQIDTQNCQKTRKQVFNRLRRDGVGVAVHYIPVHTQPFYKKSGFWEGQFPEAEAFYSRTVSLPIFPSITSDELNHVFSSLQKALND